VAEDSGLFVSGLGGRPGTATNRWLAGSDDDRADRLLGTNAAEEPERGDMHSVHARWSAGLQAERRRENLTVEVGSQVKWPSPMLTGTCETAGIENKATMSATPLPGRSRLGLGRRGPANPRRLALPKH
jgi:Ham1 family